MRLPKRVERQEKKKEEDPKEHLLKRLVSLQFPKDATILDPKNALLIFIDYENFTFKHVRLINGRLVTISKILSRNYDYIKDKIDLLNKLSLLKEANH